MAKRDLKKPTDNVADFGSKRKASKKAPLTAETKQEASPEQNKYAESSMKEIKSTYDDIIREARTAKLENLDPLQNPTVEREYASVKTDTTAGPIPEAHVPPAGGYTPPPSQPQPQAMGEKPFGNESAELKDMDQRQKKKAAEKTADILIANYCNLIPKPFKHFAKYDEDKIEKLILQDEINPNQQLQTGDTIIQYIHKFNQSVDAAFQTSEETKQEIKDPLVEVLMETNLQLTPTQRLLIAVGGDIFAKSVAAFQLAKASSETLKMFQEWHNSKKEGVVAETKVETEFHKETEIETPAVEEVPVEEVN